MIETKPYKLLLFDLDGTLLNSGRQILPENQNALKALMSRGILVGFATGRTFRSIKPYFDILKPTGPLILFNGARVWDVGSEKYISEINLGLEEAILATELVQTYDDVHVNLYIENDILISKRTARSIESEIKDGVPHTVVGELSHWLKTHQRPPVKVMFISEPTTLERFGEEFALKTKRKCSLIRSETTYLEIMNEGINKGAALAPIEKRYGIKPSEIVSFGDNLNDLDMLRLSGIGVAMENAHQELKRIADRVIGNNERASISEFLTDVFAR